MMRIYIMPNGHMYQFEESEAPAEAVLVEKKAAEPANKAKKPTNKAKKAAVKK